MSLGHIAGPVAEDALSALVAQFSDRSAFIRELVQNSLDAGAGRIDLLMETHADGGLLIEVYDDGEGMDRQIIEGCLLTLFRSSKERDLTKIGKFGVGFVSLFALDPTEVVVDTARDGITHQVRFQHDRSYRLYALDRPFEGTRVRIQTRFKGEEARKLAIAIDQALAYWCRFATADIWSEATPDGWGWAPREVRAEFDIDAPITIQVEEDSFRAVLGPSGLDHSPVAYHNRGLTLLEAQEDILPGVTFRVEAGKLEHTLTRDNVLRDAHYREVIARLKALAHGPMRARWLAALRAAIEAGDEARRTELLAVAHPIACPLPRELACFATSGGGLVSLAELQPRTGLIGRLLPSAKLYHAPPASPLAALSTSPVLVGPANAGARPTTDVTVAERFLRLKEPVQALSKAFRMAELLAAESTSELLAATDALARQLDAEPQGVRAVRLHPAPAATARCLAIRQLEPGQPRRTAQGWCDGSGSLLVNVDDPFVAIVLSHLPPAVAAPLLLRAAQLFVVPNHSLAPALADSLRAALSEPMASEAP